MLVKYWMRAPVATVDINDSIGQALTVMDKYYLMFLPVMENGRLVGAVSHEDLGHAGLAGTSDSGAKESSVNTDSTVGMVTTRNPVTVPPDFTLEETAAVLLTSQRSEALVADSNGQIVGVISLQDLLWALMSVNGYETRGVQFGVEVVDRQGAVQEITDLIRAYDGRLASVLTSLSGAASGFRRVYLRAYEIDRTQVDRLKEELGLRARLLYMIDHRENRREDFT